jgi:pimeloyl-ACP methyl ester carboxylesterase
MTIPRRVLTAALLITLFVGGFFYFNPLLVNDQRIRYHLWRARVHSRYIDAGNYQLHYFEAAPQDGSAGIPLVLVHGLASRGEDWAPLIPRLAAAGFHVYAPDLLGYGRSQKPSFVVYSIALEEGVLVDFMHAVGLQHADVDGWSMGGWISAKLALDHPAMVDRLVLDDSVGITFQPIFTRDLFTPTDPAGLNRLFALLSPHPPNLEPFVVRAMLHRIADNAQTVRSSMNSMVSGVDRLDDRLAGVTQPTLIVWGADDKLIPISVGKQMHQLIPNSALQVIPGCGHLAPSQCSGDVWAGTVAFLKANPPMRGGEFVIDSRVTTETIPPTH